VRGYADVTDEDLLREEWPVRKMVEAIDLSGAKGTSDTEGKAARVAASERGQRASFNRPGGSVNRPYL
jgi:hypothetical protein